MLKLVHALIVGLMGAAILHGVIILALPAFSERNAYARIVAGGPKGVFRPVVHDPSGQGALAPEDPFVNQMACAYDLQAGPVMINASGDAEFWSFAVFDSTSSEVFSISDRSAEAGKLDAILALPAQAAQLRKSFPERMARMILIEVPDELGYAVLRTVTPHESMRQQSLDFLKSARCTP